VYASRLRYSIDLNETLLQDLLRAHETVNGGFLEDLRGNRGRIGLAVGRFAANCARADLRLLGPARQNRAVVKF
jgi:hypothetical protein